MNDKRILTIQDISCVGQCSLTVALPIISACGIETAILPSAVLSTHTGGFKGYTFRDLTEDMPEISRHWQSEGISFDAVYTGYLGSIRQIDIVADIMDKHLNGNGIRIVDPAMADNGKLYYGFDMEFVRAMAGLCGRADIILPNITEAALMTGMECRMENQDEEYIGELLKRLSELGAGRIILKGISFMQGRLGVAIHETSTGETSYYYTERIERSSHGTGDCYASAFTGALMNGRSIAESAGIAAEFVVECIRQTVDTKNHWYGVRFEKALPMLISAICASD